MLGGGGGGGDVGKQATAGGHGEQEAAQQRGLTEHRHDQIDHRRPVRLWCAAVDDQAGGGETQQREGEVEGDRIGREVGTDGAQVGGEREARQHRFLLPAPGQGDQCRTIEHGSHSSRVAPPHPSGRPCRTAATTPPVQRSGRAPSLLLTTLPHVQLTESINDKTPP